MIEGAHDGGCQGTSKGTATDVGQDKPRRRVRTVLRQQRALDRSPERKVQTLSREAAQHRGSVATPERSEALLGVDAAKGVRDALKAAVCAIADARIGVLRLQHDLDSVDWCEEGLGRSC